MRTPYPIFWIEMMTLPSPQTADDKSVANWAQATLYALLISLFVLARFYYWFSIADRYAIFLYNHLGATPFDQVTRSRYWMAGLVAAGEVMILGILLNWAIGRIMMRHCREYHPPQWQHIWALCAPVLAIGILIITMTTNSPTLLFPDALASAAATLVGLALALMLGSLTAQKSYDLIWLAFDGVGLMPVLLLLRVVELPSRGISLPFSPYVTYPVAAGTVAIGGIWLIVMTGLRIWQHKQTPSAGALLATGLAHSYLLMPVAHHWLATPPDWRYISTSSNFFALNPVVQVVVFLTAATMALGATHIRCALETSHHGQNPA